ncbi:MAG: sugar phosphate isomerase/epimerase [Candidatus Sumerlaeaceae bacterium]|nr:sugar phosphate isomerase/epimerase [Candidatus Sumerlaeaceae bacterium]
MRKRIKNSIGIWAFGPNATRFVPNGYHFEARGEDMVTRTRRAVDACGDYFDSYEYHYPGEVNEDNLDAILKALGGKEMYCVPVGFHCMDEFTNGSFINPDKKKQKLAIKLAKNAIDIAKKVKGHLIIWPGGEGYNYPFQIDFAKTWNTFIANMAEVVEYAAQKKVKVFLEHKNSEPAMKILMRNIGMKLFLMQRIRDLGVDTSRLLVNMDFQHLIMNGEPLAEYAALLMSMGKLGHLHANSGWGTFDDDNMTGALNFMETIAIAVELQRGGYGNKGERVGFDLYPYTEDTAAAAIRSVKQWEFIMDVAAAINQKELDAARASRDAVECYRIVYSALGMNDRKIEGYFRK